jgi:hypothetical protein
LGRTGSVENFSILSSRRGLVVLGNPAASRRRDGESGGTRAMPDALFFEFTGVSAHDYRAVNKILGLDPDTGDGLGPVALLSHTGAAGPDDGFVVFEVWESQQAQTEWMASRLGPALTQAGLPEPKRVQWLTVVGPYSA